MISAQTLASEMFSMNRQTSFQRSFRRRSLWLLSLPVILAAIAFVIATTISLQPIAPNDFTGALKITGVASFGYLIFAFLYSPAYIVGLMWFFFGTSGRDADLKMRISLMPLVTACFVWCPVMFVPSLNMEERILAFLALIPTTLIVGFLWSFFVRWAVGMSLRGHPALDNGGAADAR
jgi:putative flippase GtrA